MAISREQAAMIQTWPILNANLKQALAIMERYESALEQVSAVANGHPGASPVKLVNDCIEIADKALDLDGYVPVIDRAISCPHCKASILLPPRSLRPPTRLNDGT